jgi:hypothetical protein
VCGFLGIRAPFNKKGAEKEGKDNMLIPKDYQSNLGEKGNRTRFGRKPRENIACM